MPGPRPLLTNFSKGELSPRIEGRPDLAAYFEGGRTIENFLIMRQGGLNRRPGLRMISEVKDSTKDTILLPFEASVDDAYILEFGHQYARVYKNKARTVGVEIISPYTESQLRSIHYTQSVDVMFLFHNAVAQRKISRLSDVAWSLDPIVFKPPPSFEKDTDINGGTLTPAAVTGTGILFTSSIAKFLPADVGRVIIYGASRAIITGFGASAGDTTSPNTKVRADIIDDFPSTAAIPPKSWLLQLSPQTSLDPDVKQPEGGAITLTTTIDTFRTEDEGKFITIYGGLVEITIFVTARIVKGIIRSELTGASDANPPATPAWTLETVSWSAINGYPRTGEFVQGRLGQASTEAQKTTFWLSETDGYDKYGIGAEASRAIDYTVASRRLNRIEWMGEHNDLFLGTSGSELRAQSGKSDEPFGGDIVPLVRQFTVNGSAPIQPTVASDVVIFVDRSRRKLFAISFDIQQDSYDAIEITAASEHLTRSRIRKGHVAFAIRPDPVIYYVREDGQMLALTYYKAEKVVGFARIVTNGQFQSVAIKPNSDGDDEVWVIVQRTINGQVKKFVEMFEFNYEQPLNRLWQSFQTDCAIFYKGAPTLTVPVAHLEGVTVDIIADGGYIGTRIVSNGIITLDTLASEIEIGIPYDSIVETMRPALKDMIIEGLPRSWNKIFVRLLETLGGNINDIPIDYSEDESSGLYTGDKDVTGQGWDTVGRITVKQTDPYPMTLLSVFGELSIGGS